jgi:hypothetical protein
MRSACASKGKVSRTKGVEDRQVERRGGRKEEGERKKKEARQTRSLAVTRE